MQNYNITKSSWLAHTKRLTVESELLEKNYKLPSDISELIRPELNLMHSSRIDHKQLVIKRLAGFKSMLQSIQSKVRNESILMNKKVLQEQLESFETKLTAFKILMKSEFDSFEDNAVIYESDIESLAANLEAWDLPDGDRGNEVGPETTKRINDIQQQDIERKATIGAIDRQVLL